MLGQRLRIGARMPPCWCYLMCCDRVLRLSSSDFPNGYQGAAARAWSSRVTRKARKDRTILSSTLFCCRSESVFVGDTWLDAEQDLSAGSSLKGVHSINGTPQQVTRNTTDCILCIHYSCTRLTQTCPWLCGFTRETCRVWSHRSLPYCLLTATLPRLQGSSSPAKYGVSVRIRTSFRDTLQSLSSLRNLYPLNPELPNSSIRLSLYMKAGLVSHAE